MARLAFSVPFHNYPVSTNSELIPDAPNCRNLPLGVAGDFFAETLDVNIHGAAVAGELVAPDMIKELFAGENLIRRRSQEEQELQLLWRHLDGVPLIEYGIVCFVDDEIRILDVVSAAKCFFALAYGMASYRIR